MSRQVNYVDVAQFFSKIVNNYGMVVMPTLVQRCENKETIKKLKKSLHFAIFAYHGDKLQLTCTEYGCLNKSREDFEHYMAKRFTNDLFEDDKVVITELLKLDADGVKLPYEKRGMYIERKLHRIYFGVIGFDETPAQFKEVQNVLKPLLDSMLKDWAGL